VRGLDILLHPLAVLCKLLHVPDEHVPIKRDNYSHKWPSKVANAGTLLKVLGNVDKIPLFFLLLHRQELWRSFSRCVCPGFSPDTAPYTTNQAQALGTKLGFAMASRKATVVRQHVFHFPKDHMSMYLIVVIVRSN
jgi:hypothetical protein